MVVKQVCEEIMIRVFSRALFIVDFFLHKYRPFEKRKYSFTIENFIGKDLTFRSNCQFQRNPITSR